MVSQELSQFLSVGAVFVNTQFEILAELLVEFLEVFGILTDLLEELKAFLGDVLFDDLKDLVVLEILPADVEGKILGVDNTPDETEIFGDEVLAIVHNEDSPDVELDVVFLLLGLEHVEGSPLGHEHNRSEFKSSLH